MAANNDVRKTSAAVDGMANDWGLVEALMGGTDAMRKAGKKYLPQWPAEDTGGYQARLATATLFPAYSRTISVLSGKPFSKPVSIGEDVPKKFEPWLEDVDLQGRNLHTFAADLCANALAYGFCGILVDYPPADGVRTVADEQAAGVRPYFVHVAHGAILGWRAENIKGGLRLTQLRLLEHVEPGDSRLPNTVAGILDGGCAERLDRLRLDAHVDMNDQHMLLHRTVGRTIFFVVRRSKPGRPQKTMVCPTGSVMRSS